MTALCLDQNGIREPLCVNTCLLLSSPQPVAFPETIIWDWKKKMKGGKQAEHNSARRWLSFNSKMTQRFSGPSVAFPRLRREPAPAGLDHRTRCDAYWLTHRHQGSEPDGKDTNRSDTSQQSGFCHNVSAGRKLNNEVVSFVWKLVFSLITLVVFYFCSVVGSSLKGEITAQDLKDLYHTLCTINYPTTI